MDKEPRRIPIHRSLHRPDLLAGCERELFLFLALIVSVMVFATMNWLAAGVGIMIWLCGVWGLRLMAKADPLMSQIYRRHIRYRIYYPPHSSPFALSADHR